MCGKYAYVHINVWKVCAFNVWSYVHINVGEYSYVLMYGEYSFVLMYGEYSFILMYGEYAFVLVYGEYAFVLVYGEYAASILTCGEHEVSTSTQILMMLLPVVCNVLELSWLCTQFEYLGILRANFFRVVQEHPVKEDTQQR